MKLTFDPILDANDFATLRPSDGSLHGDTQAQPIATIYQGEHAARIAACWNACHGLDLPANVPPGAVAALVDAAREALLSADDIESGISPEVLLESIGAYLRATLAPFTPDPAPVSQWGLFRRSVQTGLGPLEESIVTFHVGTEDGARENFAGLLADGDRYFLRELRADERQPT